MHVLLLCDRSSKDPHIFGERIEKHMNANYAGLGDNGGPLFFVDLT